MKINITMGDLLVMLNTLQGSIRLQDGATLFSYNRDTRIGVHDRLHQQIAEIKCEIEIKQEAKP